MHTLRTPEGVLSAVAAAKDCEPAHPLHIVVELLNLERNNDHRDAPTDLEIATRLVESGPQWSFDYHQFGLDVKRSSDGVSYNVTWGFGDGFTWVAWKELERGINEPHSVPDWYDEDWIGCEDDDV